MQRTGFLVRQAAPRESVEVAQELVHLLFLLENKQRRISLPRWRDRENIGGASFSSLLSLIIVIPTDR